MSVLNFIPVILGGNIVNKDKRRDFVNHRKDILIGEENLYVKIPSNPSI
jgi:hypothetical protein